jgi:integrase
VVPALGKTPLADLRPHHIQAYYVEALKSGRTDGTGGLSPRTVAYHHRILSEALEQAVRQNLLVRNPAKMVDPPRPKRAEIGMLAAEDIRRFLQAAAESEYFGLLVAALYTGARLGELLALQWRNVDLDKRTMTITHTLYRTGSEWHLKEPKSARSRRQIVMPASLASNLLEHRKTLEAERAAMGGVLTAEDFVFGQLNGKPRDERSVNRGFDRVLRNAGLRHIRFHDLRHTHASLLLKAGVHPKVVSERLGHGSVSFTLDVYSHVMPGLQESAAVKLEELIGGTP